MEKHNEQISMFMKNVWFYLFFFILLMAMASYGLIAES